MPTIGSVIEPGTTGLGIDKQGWRLHAAVHEARPDIRCIIHLNTPATVAVSCYYPRCLCLTYPATMTCKMGMQSASDFIVPILNAAPFPPTGFQF